MPKRKLGEEVEPESASKSKSKKTTPKSSKEKPLNKQESSSKKKNYPKNIDEATNVEKVIISICLFLSIFMCNIFPI